MLTYTEQTTISPFRFIVMRPPSSSDNEDEAAEGDGGQLRVGQSLILVPCIPGSPTADDHLVALPPQEGGDDDALQVGIGVCAEEEQDKQQQALTKNIVLIIDAVVDSSSSSASSPQAHTPLPPPQDEEKQQLPDDTTSTALSTQDKDTGGDAAALMDLPLTAREVVVIFEEGELGVTIKVRTSSSSIFPSLPLSSTPDLVNHLPLVPDFAVNFQSTPFDLPLPPSYLILQRTPPQPVFSLLHLLHPLSSHRLIS